MFSVYEIVSQLRNKRNLSIYMSCTNMSSYVSPTFHGVTWEHCDVHKVLGCKAHSTQGIRVRKRTLEQGMSGKSHWGAGAGIDSWKSLVVVLYTCNCFPTNS